MQKRTMRLGDSVIGGSWMEGGERGVRDAGDCGVPGGFWWEVQACVERGLWLRLKRWMDDSDWIGGRSLKCVKG